MKNLGDQKSWQVHKETICYDEPLGTHATTNTRPILLGCHQCIENSTKPHSVPMNGLQANTNTSTSTNTNTNTNTNANTQPLLVVINALRIQQNLNGCQ